MRPVNSKDRPMRTHVVTFPEKGLEGSKGPHQVEAAPGRDAQAAPDVAGPGAPGDETTSGRRGGGIPSLSASPQDRWGGLSLPGDPETNRPWRWR